MPQQPLAPYPDRYSAQDRLRYLGDAVSRETGAPWFPPRHEVAIWAKLLKDYDDVDPYEMACALDFLALNWTNRPPWEALSAGALMWPIRRSLFKDKAWWRAVWFSRFATTQRQTAFYAFWLDHLEDALLNDNSTGLRKATAKLREAERRIRDTDGAPTFTMHLLRNIGITSEEDYA